MAELSLEEFATGRRREIPLSEFAGERSGIPYSDIATGVGRGAFRAATGLLGMPADIYNTVSAYAVPGMPFFGPSMADRAARATGQTPQHIPLGTSDIQQGAYAVTPEGFRTTMQAEPETRAGRYAQTMTEWGLPTAVTGAGTLARRLVTGALSGATAQGASDVAQPLVSQTGRYEPYLDAAIRTIAGLSAYTLLNRPLMQRANPSEVVRETTRDVTPADWAAAERRMAASGGRLLPAEALGEAGQPLAGLTSDVASSRFGSPINTALRGRAESVRGAAADEINNIAPVVEPADVARNVSAGARSVIQDARRVRANAASPHYEAAVNDPVPSGSLNPVINQPAAAFDPASPIAARIRHYADRMRQAQNGAQLDNIYKELRDEVRALQAADPSSAMAANLARLRDALNTQLVGGPGVPPISPNIAAGRQAHIANTPRVEELRRPEILGNMQGEIREGQRVAPQLSRQIDVIAGETATPRTIGRVFDELQTSRQPAAARDLGATWLRRTLENAATPGGAQAEQNLVGARWRNALAGTPEQTARTEAVIRGMARTNGQNPDAVWAGFNRMLDWMAQTSRIPAIGSRTGPREQLARSLGSNWGSTAMDTLNITRGSFLRGASTSMAERAAASDYRVLANALSSPEGLTILRQLAGQFPNSPRAQVMMTRFLNLGREVESTAARSPE